MTNAQQLKPLSISHANVGQNRFQFTVTEQGVIARKMGPGQHKFTPESNLIAIQTEGNVVWKREARLTAENQVHLFTNTRDAQLFALR